MCDYFDDFEGFKDEYDTDTEMDDSFPDDSECDDEPDDADSKDDEFMDKDALIISGAFGLGSEQGSRKRKTEKAEKV